MAGPSRNHFIDTRNHHCSDTLEVQPQVSQVPRECGSETNGLVYHPSYFLSEETEAQKGEVTTQISIEPGLEPSALPLDDDGQSNGIAKTERE